VRLIDDAERRARLARRHALAPQHRVADAPAAARAMTVLHATEAATPYLSLFARIESFTRPELGEALFGSKSLIKQLAMRRTLFVFPRELLPAAMSGPCARVARQESGRLVKDLERGQVTADGARWLATAQEAVLAPLASGAELSAQELRPDLAELAGQVSWHGHKPYGQVVHVAPRVLSWLSATGDVVRGRNAGHGRTSRPLWTRMDDWLGSPVDRCDVGEGYAGSSPAIWAGSPRSPSGTWCGGSARPRVRCARRCRTSTRCRCGWTGSRPDGSCPTT
jgi:hypothetical protein